MLPACRVKDQNQLRRQIVLKEPQKSPLHEDRLDRYLDRNIFESSTKIILSLKNQALGG
jgi:hypothetical protein